MSSINRYIVGVGSIKPLCDLLTVHDVKVIIVVLETLENILSVGESLVKSRQEGSNPYTQLIEEAEGKLPDSLK